MHAQLGYLLGFSFLHDADNEVLTCSVIWIKSIALISVRVYLLGIVSYSVEFINEKLMLKDSQ
jgi:hypothetical protein